MDGMRKLNTRQLETIERYAGKTLARLGYSTAGTAAKTSQNREPEMLGVPEVLTIMQDEQQVTISVGNCSCSDNRNPERH